VIPDETGTPPSIDGGAENQPDFSKQCAVILMEII
jgi:hypothetical protein